MIAVDRIAHDHQTLVSEGVVARGFETLDGCREWFTAMRALARMDSVPVQWGILSPYRERKLAESGRVVARPEGRVGAWIARRDEQELAKGRARRKLRDSVKRGRVEKPVACERCGQAARPGSLDERRVVLQAHHPDYSRPLDVLWLCPACHSDEHHYLAIEKQRPLTVQEIAARAGHAAGECVVRGKRLQGSSTRYCRPHTPLSAEATVGNAAREGRSTTTQPV